MTEPGPSAPKRKASSASGESKKKPRTKRTVRTVTCRDGDEVHYKTLTVANNEELKLHFTGGKLTIDEIKMAPDGKFHYAMAKVKGLKIGNVTGGKLSLGE